MPSAPINANLVTGPTEGLEGVAVVGGVPPSARSDGGGSPRPVIRGESSICIDWLSFTFPASDDWERWLKTWLFAHFGLQGWVESRHGLHGYSRSADVAELVKVGWGGNRGTVYVSIPGSVSGAVDSEGWSFIASSLEERAARISRVDLAFDDYQGRHITTRKAVKWYKDGAFSTGGRQSSARLIDDLGSGKGCTLYLGKRENGKMLRIYDKGKQLGVESSPWVRVELQLGNRDRVIPFEILLRPQDALAASYGPLGFISESRLIVRAIKAVGLIKLAECIKYAKLQAGPLIHALLRVEGGDIGRVIDQVCQWGRLPRRLDMSTLRGVLS